MVELQRALLDVHGARVREPRAVVEVKRRGAGTRLDECAGILDQTLQVTRAADGGAAGLGPGAMVADRTGGVEQECAVGMGDRAVIGEDPFPSGPVVR